jgi:hypothetical protein
MKGIVNFLSDFSSSRYVYNFRRMSTPSIKRHKHYRSATDIINHGVWLYFRFSLNDRDVEELFARGVIVTYEVIRKGYRCWLISPSSNSRPCILPERPACHHTRVSDPSGPAPRERPRPQKVPHGDDHQPGILRVHDILDGSEQVSQGDGVAR